MKKQFDFFKQKKVTTFFAIIALIGSFFFLNYNITGNVVQNNKTAFSLISIIGAALIICSIILGLYTLKGKGD